MNLNQLEQNLYRLRVMPTLNKLLKQMQIDSKSFDNEELINFFYSQIPSEEIMGLSDSLLTQKLIELMSAEPAKKLLGSAKVLPKSETSNFDIRHKETLRLFLKEYFELFFPDLAERMLFDTATFLDKELIALFGDDDSYMRRFTDALIAIEIVIDDSVEPILIHWEQQGEKPQLFEERIFHYFCGIYFKYKKVIFSIAMFTDSAKEWRKPVTSKYSMSLLDYPINEFTYRIIRLKSFNWEVFQDKSPDNPLTWAYLPLTDYPKEKRPVIKAIAEEGITKTVKNECKKTTLFSLVSHCLKLDKKEEKEYRELVDQNPDYEEVKMVQTIRDLGREEGREEEARKTREATLDVISLGLEHKFGKEGTDLYPEITRLKDVGLLFAIQKGLWTSNSLSELCRIYK